MKILHYNVSFNAMAAIVHRKVFTLDQYVKDMTGINQQIFIAYTILKKTIFVLFAQDASSKIYFKHF